MSWYLIVFFQRQTEKKKSFINEFILKWQWEKNAF